MAKLTLKKAITDATVYLFIQDSSKTTGEGLTGLAYNTASLVASYVRPLAARAALSLATQTVDGGHSDGGFVEVDATNMPGIYRLDLSDAVCATGVSSVVVMLKGAANMSPCVLEIQLTDFDLNTAFTSALVADAICDEALSGHTSAGTVAKAISDTLADTGTDGVIVASLANDSITAAALKADAVAEIQNGLATPTNITAGTITTVTSVTNGVTLADDAITAAKFDETTAFPTKSADTGATALARVGADSDTLETLSDQMDAIKTETASILEDTGTTLDDLIDDLETRLTAARAGYLDKLNVSGTLAHSDAAATYQADVSALALEATLTAIKGAEWTDETLAALMTAIEAIETGSGGGATADEIWDELLSGHTSAGSAGKALSDILTDTGTDIPALIAALSAWQATNVTSAVASGSITDVRGSSWSIAIEDLTLDSNKQQFAIKRNAGDLDAQALLLVDSATGLLTLNGASTGLTAADASLVYSGTTLTLTVKPNITAQIPSGAWKYGIQYVTAAGVVEEPYGGTFTVSPDVVRAVA